MHVAAELDEAVIVVRVTVAVDDFVAPPCGGILVVHFRGDDVEIGCALRSAEPGLALFRSRVVEFFEIAGRCLAVLRRPGLAVESFAIGSLAGSEIGSVRRALRRFARNNLWCWGLATSSFARNNLGIRRCATRSSEFGDLGRRRFAGNVFSCGNGGSGNLGGARLGLRLAKLRLGLARPETGLCIAWLGFWRLERTRFGMGSPGSARRGRGMFKEGRSP